MHLLYCINSFHINSGTCYSTDNLKPIRSSQAISSQVPSTAGERSCPSGATSQKGIY